MTAQEVAGWFTGRCPDGWFVEAPEVCADREEIVVVGTVADVESGAEAGRVKRFR
ncbi:MAG: hypothetical protein QOI47_2071, partial [Actinomycetota bacterium]|nr:hypothetical protein [Actinomycetota bacterium]